MTGTIATLSDFPQLTGVEHRYVDLPGLRMHVAEAGRGEPVLLLHGYPQHWWEWRGVIPQLAEHYRVIAPDLRGAGWTEAPPTGYDRDTLVTDVLGLLDRLGLDTVRIVAHDWGALAAFALCLQHPDRVRALVSLAVPHPFLRFDSRMLRTLHLAWYQFVLTTPGLGAYVQRSGRQPLPRHLLRRHSARQDAMSDADVDLFVRPLRDRAHARAASALYRGFIQPEAMRVMRGVYRNTRLTTPTLVLTGAQDAVVRAHLLGGYEPYADALEVREIAGAAHFIVDDQPETVLHNALELFGRA
jgi:pimeloyl-ACP methyl ester carboxylesterase